MGYSLVIFLLVTSLLKITTSQDYICSQPVDVVILVDSSSYFGEINFTKLKSLLYKNFLPTHFKLSENKLFTSISFISYSDKATNVVNFFKSNRGMGFLTKNIQNRLNFEGGLGTRMDLALKSARGSLIGFRDWVPRVVVAITGSFDRWDGVLKNAVKREALAVRAKGIQLLLVNIGNIDGEDYEALGSMVAFEEDLFLMSEPDGFNQKGNEIVRRLCPVLGTFEISCPGKVDIAFIVDSSGSISTMDYAKIKYFMYALANALSISENGTHVGVVLYSDSAKLAVRFNEHKNIASFQRAVYELDHIKGFTRIDKGLRIAHVELFTEAYGGAREDATKLAFILTDGNQTAVNGVKPALRKAAKPLIDSGIKTLSVGVGSSFIRSELRAMVEYDQDVITAVNFNELLLRIENITKQACEKIALTECNYPADIAFLLDSSNNVRSDDFEKQKQFVKSMSKRFIISQYGNRGAVIVFGSEARLSIQLDDIVNSVNFIKAVDRVSRNGGVRQTFNALDLAEQVLTVLGGEARRKVSKAVVLFSAGPEKGISEETTLILKAKGLHDRNILVFLVEVTSGRSTAELSPLVESAANLFSAKSFTELDSKVEPLARELCKHVGPGLCEDDVDLAFILDSSGSISEENFFEARKFMKNIAGTFTISKMKTRMALMIYSDDALIMSNFGKIQSEEDLRNKLDELPHLKGKTRIDRALKLAGDELFTQSGGARMSLSVKKVCIVITDGRQSPAADGIGLDQAVAPLLVNGVKVLSIGIGDKIDRYELNMMVSDPEQHTFWAPTYRALGVQLATIARESCSRRTFIGKRRL